MLYPVWVGKEKLNEIKQIRKDQLARLPEISSLTTSGLGEYHKDKETIVQHIPTSFFTVSASNSNSTRFNPFLISSSHQH